MMINMENDNMSESSFFSEEEDDMSTEIDHKAGKIRASKGSLVLRYIGNFFQVRKPQVSSNQSKVDFGTIAGKDSFLLKD